jgi:N utilization substance protein B
VIKILEENHDFERKENAFKINWSGETEMVRKFYKKLRKSEIYKHYMENKNSSFDEDKLLFIKITDKLLPEFELLKSFYEEKSVYFTDGYDLVILLLIKFFETVSPAFSPDRSLPGLYKAPANKDNEDLEFVKKLYKKTILQDAEGTEIIQGKTINWDYERIPLMDIILLKMAIIELKEMETVPVKVTLNEYIELAKYFSSSKSKTFVNGVLDRVIREFREEGKLKKTGRGLID